MNEPAVDNTPPTPGDPNAGVAVFVNGAYGIVGFLVIWQGLLWLLRLILPRDKAAPVAGVVETGGIIVAVLGAIAGFNYVVWKYFVDAWLRWLVFGLEACILLFVIYGFWITSHTPPPVIR